MREQWEHLRSIETERVNAPVAPRGPRRAHLTTSAPESRVAQNHGHTPQNHCQQINPPQLPAVNC